MKTLTSIQAIVLICLSSCGREDAKEQKSGTATSAKPVTAAQTPGIITPKLTTELPKIEDMTSSNSAETLEKIMQKRKTSDFESASKQFETLVKQGGVVGSPVAQVKKLLGDPDAETDTSISYRFEAGFGGWNWVLEHDGKKVLGYTRKGIN